ncbi:cytochrome c oxidase subunit 3 family protein [Aquabacterium sp.]|uniref:cytochrome c oxidase subunit 3 family protein n=1 Tax=Aquabacterium sp. TaxID=1872578 RepID=UPI0035B494CA
MSTDNEVPVPPRLAGDFVIWLVILAELLTFGILFLSFAVTRVRQPAVFSAAQQTLDLHSGVINTLLLVSGSWCVARAVQAIQHDLIRAGARWLLGALACGGAFLLVKSLEYAAKLHHGIDISTNDFYTLYFILTGFHFLHVLVAELFLLWLFVFTVRGRYGRHDHHALESGAAFWHMVDLLWIVLFPLVYVMR